MSNDADLVDVSIFRVEVCLALKCATFGKRDEEINPSTSDFVPRPLIRSRKR
jgi:hypothetical protein